MAQRPLTDTEQDFADSLADLLMKMAEIQSKAQAVKSSGGDCREALLTIASDEDRPMLEMQWPYISMMLGV